jgi:ketosteroid isomerase-like protein
MQARDPESVVHALDEALNAGDVDRARALFADQATVNLVPPPAEGPAVYTGAEQIRGWLEQLVAGHFHVESSGYHTAQDKVTWRSAVSHDDWRALGVNPAEVSSVASVEGGRITAFTVTFSPETVKRFEAAGAGR